MEGVAGLTISHLNFCNGNPSGVGYMYPDPHDNWYQVEK